MKLIGIDDAGRGPVLGPMVLCGVMLESEKDEQELKDLGVKDSKLLYPKQRAKIARTIAEKYENHIEIATPKEIDEFPNLNNLEAIKCGLIINAFLEDLNEKVKVVVDCPSVNTEAWSQYLFETVIKKDLVELICEHKADYNYPVVGAASIVAKEKREEDLKRLRKDLGVNFGSGYPSDPKTKEFLVKYFGDTKFDELIRKSWKTYKNIQDRMSQKSLFYL